LKAILASSPLINVIRGVRAGRKLGHRERAYGEFKRELFGGDLVKVDNN
jgi:hypothetical protein